MVDHLVNKRGKLKPDSRETVSEYQEKRSVIIDFVDRHMMTHLPLLQLMSSASRNVMRSGNENHHTLRADADYAPNCEKAVQLALREREETIV
jgi:hypothetical protein